jgi:hypothetical protein
MACGTEINGERRFGGCGINKMVHCAMVVTRGGKLKIHSRKMSKFA